ncbi:MAG: N-(5'-phosphoribosyl)anthranilate isomerase [Planctomycetaceae bacterium]|nr:N-(5'-phosphoribosyl)anthranilate isomerase [Planctomycetaceae bacterium]
MVPGHPQRYTLHAMSSTRIKICGVRSTDIADVAIDAGAHMIGLNFVPASPRHVAFPEARQIAQHINARAQVVGLFKDESLPVVGQHFNDLPLTLAQIHGPITPQALSDSSIPRYLRAVSFDPQTFPAQLQQWNAHHIRDDRLDGLIVDTPDPTQIGGGTGKTFDWSALRDIIDQVQPQVPLILAGGLTPENVADAVRTVQPAAVDVSSGVESSRGIKDPARIRAFCDAVRNAND